MLCTSLLLFNFQGSFASAFRGDLVIIPPSSRFVKPFLKTFFAFFKVFSRRSPDGHLRRPRGQLVYFTTLRTVCQYFFRLFFIFGGFTSLHTTFAATLWVFMTISESMLILNPVFCMRHGIPLASIRSIPEKRGESFVDLKIRFHNRFP